MEEIMTKIHRLILPILAVIFCLFSGSSTSKAETIEKLTEQLREVENLPSGTVFQLKLTDDDATSAAEEYLLRYMEDIQAMIQQTAGFKISLSDPKIIFNDDMLVISIRGGLGVLKVTVSASAHVLWEDNMLKVDVKSVDIPVISVDPPTINSYIQDPLNDFINDLMEGYEVRSFDVEEYAILEAVKR